MSEIKLAARASVTDISGIRKVFDLAAGLKNPINLSIGQPDFDVPDNIKSKACEAINKGYNSYSPTQGRADLLAALHERLGGRYAEGEVIVTSAVSGGLNLSFLALLDPGDEILVPDPYFVMYKQLALMIGAKPVYYDTYPDFKLPLDKIEQMITPRTKAFVVGSPSNPTGAVYGAEELKQLAAILDKHGIIAITDEIYDIFCYDQKFASISDYYPHNTVVLRGFSKSHAMTGWRLGYAAGPKAIIQTMAKFQQFTFVCAPMMSQYAGIEALDTDMSEFVDIYRCKRDRIYNGLRDIGYDVQKPGGAFYIFPRVPWGSDEEFVGRCIENNLLVIPGSVFSQAHTHFRISYAAADEVIDQGLEVMRRLYDGC